MNEGAPPTRFFVTVTTADRIAFSRLPHYGFDLFEEAATQSSDGGYAIEGLLSLPEIGRLAEDGFRVLVKEESSTKVRARTEIGDLQGWLERRKKR